MKFLKFYLTQLALWGIPLLILFISVDLKTYITWFQNNEYIYIIQLIISWLVIISLIILIMSGLWYIIKTKRFNQ